MKGKRNNAENIYPLLKEIEEGRMSVVEFCERTNLKESSYVYWRSKYRRSKKSTNAFISIGSAGSSDHAMEIILNSGIRMRFSSLLPMDYLRMLLRSE